MTPRKIIIHCSATKNGAEYPLDQLKKDHLARGFSDIGYHFIIQPNGEAMIGRSMGVQGAHCEGQNLDSIGVCMVGTDKFTTAQFAALEETIDKIFFRYTSIPHSAIYAHCQFPSAQRQGKTCPNMEINKLLYWYHMKDDNAVDEYILRPGVKK